MTESSFEKSLMLSNNSFASQEKAKLKNKEGLNNFESIASLVVHHDNILAKEKHYCISLQQHFNESEIIRNNLAKGFEEIRENIEVFKRREQMLFSTRNKLEESFRTFRIRLNDCKKVSEAKSIARKEFLLNLSNVNVKHDQIFRNIKVTFSKELAEENESLCTILDNHQRIRNQIRNKLNALQDAPSTDSYEWNLWQEQVIRVAELLNQVRCFSKIKSSNTAAHIKSHCQMIPSSSATTNEETLTGRGNKFGVLQNNNAQFKLMVSENSSILRDFQAVVKPPSNLSDKPQISASLKMSKLKFSTLKVPPFRFFKNSSNCEADSLNISSNVHLGENQRVVSSSHNKFETVNNVSERLDSETQNKDIVAGKDVHPSAEETSSQRPTAEQISQKIEIGNALREEPKTSEPEGGKFSKKKNIFKTFLNSLTEFSASTNDKNKNYDQSLLRNSSDGKKSENFAVETFSCEEEETSEERNFPPQKDNFFYSDSENARAKVSYKECSNSREKPKDNKVNGKEEFENMDVASKSKSAEPVIDSMVKTLGKSVVDSPICGGKRNEDSEKSVTCEEEGGGEDANDDDDEIEMEVSTSDVLKEKEDDVVMLSPRKQPMSEPFCSQFSFNLFDKQEDFLSSVKESSFSLYDSPQAEQRGGKISERSCEESSFLFGMIGSASPKENSGFNFSFKERIEEDRVASPSKSAHDFFSLFSSPSSEQNIASSQPTFSLF